MTTELTVKERPILFSRPMVRAILEGRKTMTRRVMKPQPLAEVSGLTRYFSPSDMYRADYKEDIPSNIPGINYTGLVVKCPYGKIGDRLWVRETWRSYDLDGTVEGAKQTLRYLADGNEALITWKPSIFMPRWASRITLEITDIRVERLQQISEQDIEAEGTPVNPMGQLSYRHDYHQRLKDWQYLWDKINGTKPGYDWQSNPFVWVIEFKRINPEG